MTKPITNLVGKKFGRLTVVSLNTDRARPPTRWLCRCDCGNTTVAAAGMLGRNTNSCGCLRDESRIAVKTKHGMHGTKIYRTWSNMKNRATNLNDVRSKDYVGRGIGCCERWLTFENFYEDMGDCPEGMWIERIDNDKGYSKANCEWATVKEQQYNKRNTFYAYYKGQRLPVGKIAELCGIPRWTVDQRVRKYGERAMDTYVWTKRTRRPTPIAAGVSA